VPPHCPVKRSYKKSLHTLCVASSPKNSSHTQQDHATILVKWIQPLQEQVHNILQQAKHDNFFSKASSSPRFRFKKRFHGNLKQWIPLLAKGRRIIQAEIDGHPPIPLAQNRGFHLGNFSMVVRVLNLCGLEA
jgi:hypothetical protein